jgi:hypothetical protein
MHTQVPSGRRILTRGSRFDKPRVMGAMSAYAPAIASVSLDARGPAVESAKAPCADLGCWNAVCIEMRSWDETTRAELVRMTASPRVKMEPVPNTLGKPT